MSTYKNVLLIGAMMLLVLIGRAWYVSHGSSSVTTAPGTTASAISTFPISSPFTEGTRYYTIAVNYPTTTPLTAAANQAALQMMRSYLAGQVVEFKTQGNFNHLTQQNVQVGSYGLGHKESLQIDYLIASSAHTVSYIYTEYIGILGAHSNLFFKTFTFDKTTGKLLSLGAVFKDGSSYLKKLSVLTRAQLTDSLGPSADTQMLNSGTKPQESSFQNFFFDNGYFVLLFSPYQVAAYAAGPQTVRLPASSLRGVLSPQYP